MEHDVEVHVGCAVRTVYDQWTQFTYYPRIMESVDEVEQIDDRHLAWTVTIAGVTRTWHVAIVEQIPDERIAWISTHGTRNRGVVTFSALSSESTHVRLQFEMDPAGVLERVADWGGFVSDRIEKAMAGFKEFIEDRGHPTGSWRGRIERSDEHPEILGRHWLRHLTKHQLLDLASVEQIEVRRNVSKRWLVDALTDHRHRPLRQ